MSEISDRSNRNYYKRPVVIIAAVVILLAVIALIIGVTIAGQQAHDYQAKFSQWQSSEKSKVIALGTKLPPKLFKEEKMVTSDGLERQRQTCDALETTVKTAQSAPKQLPTLPYNVMGWTNSDYTDAAKNSKQRQQHIKEYIAAVQKTFTQIRTDCEWNTSLNTAAKKRDDLREKARGYLMKKGQTQVVNGNRRICRQGGCLPVDHAQFDKYIATYRQSIDENAKHVTPKFNETSCQDTSLGKDFCSATYTTWHTMDAAYVEWINTTAKVGPSPSSAQVKKITKSYDKLMAAYKAIGKQMNASILKAYPELSTMKSLDTTSAASENVFINIATLKLDQLTPLRTKVQSL